MASAARGDRRAWSGLYSHYAPIIHALLLLSIAKRDADELTHDVFLKAMAKLQDLRDHSAFGAWLCQIARNESMTWARRQHTSRLHLAKLSTQKPLALADDTPPSPLDTDKVLETLRQLPEAYRETLALRLIANLTGSQIAAATGMTHASVRVNLCRGMSLLREALGLSKEATP